MTVEYLPVGIKCNLSCTYCYQEPMRRAGNYAPLRVDFGHAKDAIRKAGSFALFGGEPLLTPIDHLAEIFEFGDSIQNKNGLQTNGILITPAHIDLFLKHKVHVGVSIDGPGLCNSARCSDSNTELSINNIELLLASGISTSLIITIHALNYLHFSELLGFIDGLVAKGLNSINFHNLEIDNFETAQMLKLSDEANLDAFWSLYCYMKRKRVYCNPFGDIVKLLTEVKPYTSCIWNNCDPITTPAVHGINTEGSLVNCGRTNKEGIDWLKASDVPSYERYIALSLTDQGDGGCKDCQYFFACKGNCPGTAIDGDWRNRTVDCRFWYGLIDKIREDISGSMEVLGLESANQEFIASLYRPQFGGSNQAHTDVPHGDSHGDHTDYPTP